MKQAKKKQKRVNRVVAVRVAEVYEEPKVAAFYVNGTSVAGGAPHVTPWATLAQALAAARAYLDALNTWWAADHPGEMYLDPDYDVITDTIHPIVRAGVLPSIVDSPPPPSAPAVLEDWNGGIDWLPI